MSIIDFNIIDTHFDMIFRKKNNFIYFITNH